MPSIPVKLRPWRRGAALAAAALALAACSSSTSSSSSSSTGNTSSQSANASNSKHLTMAYLSFAVENSYDAPMLAAAQAVASDNNATLKVFDANNSPQTQYSQLQDVITSGQYDGIILQPIFGTGLVTLVQQAIAKGIKVVNMDQVLGPNYATDAPQVTGLAANVMFVPTEIGTKLGNMVVQACQSKNLNPCNVGYLYDIKASALDVAIRNGFNQAIAGHPSVKVVSEGQSFFTPSKGLAAVQTMIQGNSGINLIVGSDQGIEGAVQAVSPSKVTLVGYGGSQTGLKGIAAGTWYGTIMQLPATEGRLAVQCAIAAVQSGKDCGGVDPVDALPQSGVVTKANVSSFKGEWPG